MKQYGIELPEFPGWKPLKWDGDFLRVGDRFVWIKKDKPQSPLWLSPETTESVVEEISSNTRTPYDEYGVGTAMAYAVYRRSGPKEYVPSISFGKVLPLP